MNRVEQRLKRLKPATPQQPCNHRLGILFDLTEEEVEELENQLASCPNCIREDGPKVMIIRRND